MGESLRTLGPAGRHARDPQRVGCGAAAARQPGWCNWFGLHAPRGTPKAVLDRLAQVTQQALTSETVSSRIREVGNSLAGDGPAPLLTCIEQESRVFGEVVRAQNIRAD